MTAVAVAAAAQQPSGETAANVSCYVAFDQGTLSSSGGSQKKAIAELLLLAAWRSNLIGVVLDQFFCRDELAVPNFNGKQFFVVDAAAVQSTSLWRR